jgi:hypothetical protein
MAINKRSNQATVDITGNGNMIRSRLKGGDCLLAIPITLKLKTMFVKPATAIAVTEVVWIIVLESFLTHAVIPISQGLGGATQLTASEVAAVVIDLWARNDERRRFFL